MAKFKFPLRAHLSGRKEALLWGGAESMMSPEEEW